MEALRGAMLGGSCKVFKSWIDLYGRQWWMAKSYPSKTLAINNLIFKVPMKRKLINAETVLNLLQN